MNKKYSYSKVACFKSCPLKYKYRYLDNEPFIKSEALIKGSYCHSQFELFFKNLQDKDLNNKSFDELPLTTIEFKYPEEMKNFLLLEKKRYDKYHWKNNYKPVSIEEHIEDDELNTHGYLDRIYNLWNDKGKVLLDYKTGKVRSKSNYYPQLALYTYMYNKKHPEDPIKYWNIDWVSEEGKYFIESINENIINKTIKEYKNTINNIETCNKYYAKKTPLCLWCDYLHICPHRYEIIAKYKSIIKKKKLKIYDKIKSATEYRYKILKSNKPLIIFSKIAGISFKEEEGVINKIRSELIEDTPLQLERDPTNKFDKNAIKVMFNNTQLGYIRANLAKDLAYGMDHGKKYICTIADITGHTDEKQNTGINIKIEVLK